MNVIDRIVSGESNVTVRVNGHTYRVCVYRAMGLGMAEGFASFAESSVEGLGFVRTQTTARAAWLKALRLIVGRTPGGVVAS